MKNIYIGKTAVWMGLGLTMLLSAGCMSSHAGSSSLAHRVIQKASPELVHQTTIRIFRENAYTLATDDGAGKLVFERDATRNDRVRWGRYGEQSMRMRVDVGMEPYSKNDILMRADAYIIRPRGAEKVTYMGRRPYKKLLKKVDKAVKKEAKKKK